MFIQNYEELVEKLEGKLEDYLQKMGINTSGMFKCINPDHDDKSPSCSIQGNDKRTFHCFSCLNSGSIFKAAHYLEGKPLAGKEFALDNVLYLAKMFEIPVQMTEPTEAELYEIDTYRAYKLAADYLVQASKKEIVTKEIQRRGWSVETCRKMSVGSISSFKDFRDIMKSHGFSATFLDDVDLGRRDLFSEENLIFTIKDERGRPVGFACRNMAYDGTKEHGSKYVNQKTTGLKCNIYQKGKRLFGFDQIVSAYGKKGGTSKAEVYIFEGYADVMTAVEAGLDTCCAPGGTAFTADHLFLLKDYGFSRVILCLDGDHPGQAATAKILDDIFAGHKDVDVKIINLPDDEDPDSFIREQGIQEFKKLKKWSAFEWRLSQFKNEEDEEAVCAAMIPLIVGEPNRIKQKKMEGILSSATGLDAATIHSEVERLQNERENKKAIERSGVIDKMIKKIQRDPSSTETALMEAQSTLYDLMRQYNEDVFSEEAYLGFLSEQKKLQENKSGEFSGFILGPKFQSIQDALNGEWRQDVFGLIGGKANAGKSRLLGNLAYYIALYEKENNACVIYHTIDDTKEQLLPPIVCVAAGNRSIEINEVVNPPYYIKNGKDISAPFSTGYQRLQDLGKRGRFIIKDANDGNSLAFIESLMKYYRGRYQERNIVYILDNFHKLSDLSAASADTSMYRAMSQRMKYLAGKYHMTVLCSAEYRKTQAGSSLSNDDLYGTNQLEYDANLVIHLNSDLNDRGERAEDYHLEFGDSGLKKLPRVRLNFGKNKITSFKGDLYYDFWPSHADFEPAKTSVVLSEREERKQNDKKPKTIFE